MTGTFLYASLYLGQIGSRPVGTPRVPTMRSWRPMASRNSSEPWFMVTTLSGVDVKVCVTPQFVISFVAYATSLSCTGHMRSFVRSTSTSGLKKSTPDWKFSVSAPVVTWMAALTMSRAATPLRGPSCEALNWILM